MGLPWGHGTFVVLPYGTYMGRGTPTELPRVSHFSSDFHGPMGLERDFRGIAMALWDLRGASVVVPWGVHGTSVGFPTSNGMFRGVPMVCSWDFPGTSGLWDFHGAMELPWDFRGAYYFSWDFLGVPMRLPSHVTLMRLPLHIHGTMGLPWCLRGGLMGLPWDFS